MNLSLLFLNHILKYISIVVFKNLRKTWIYRPRSQSSVTLLNLTVANSCTAPSLPRRASCWGPYSGGDHEGVRTPRIQQHARCRSNEDAIWRCKMLPRAESFRKQTVIPIRIRCSRFSVVFGLINRLQKSHGMPTTHHRNSHSTTAQILKATAKKRWAAKME